MLELHKLYQICCTNKVMESFLIHYFDGVLFFFLSRMSVRKLYCLNGNRCNNLINGGIMWMMEQKNERNIYV